MTMMMMDYLSKSSERGKMQRSGGSFYLMLLLLMILLLDFYVNTEAKSLQRNKKSLEIFKKTSFSSVSLMKLRQKRDTFAEEYKDDGAEEYYEYDDNYDVIPDMSGGGDGDGEYPNQQQPPNIGDQISAKAKEVAESFTQMWQSVTDSVRRCINALHSLFDDIDETADDENEEKQQLRIAMEEYYRAKTMQNNEVPMNSD